jgi:eukaryotic-like serine/threonine-protein kinase
MNSGQTIAHYHIIRPLGKGGMGEVYLAHDAKLDRDVAVKVLPESLRSDPERLVRFRREAKAAASLNHPNIGTIHSIEDADGVMFIVMEYVDGQTLAEAIPEGGMDLDAFFATFIPLADALAHAHEQGRVHRDIKPGNIMIAKDGTPKILDFGLARIMPAEESSDPEAPTMTMKADDIDPSAMHDGPRIMGTPQYMSPEQAEGRELDHRTDIFSFGVVMYEALTGKKAFEGASRTSLLGKIVNEDPEPVTTIKAVTPYLLWTLVRSCIKKERDRRMQTALQLNTDLEMIQQDVRTGINGIVDPRAISEDSSKVPIRLSQYSVQISVLMVLMVLSGLTVRMLITFPEAPLRKFQIADIESINTRTATLSPDGTMMAYIARDQVWIRELSVLDSRAVQDSQGAVGLFWSPDSKFLGYAIGNTLWKASVRGSELVKLCELPGISNWKIDATWGTTGIIITDWRGDLVSVPDRGGDSQVVASPDSSAGEKEFNAPHFLPDGNSLLYGLVLYSGSSDIGLLSGGTRTTLVSHEGVKVNSPVYSPTGHLVYSRDGGVWAQSFHLSELSVTGPAFPVAGKGGWPSVSIDGTMIYRTPGRMIPRQLVWVDRSGTVLDTIGRQWQELGSPIISPEGRQVMVTATVAGNTDLWMYEFDRETLRRLTSDPAWDGNAVWSPEGDRIAFGSRRDGTVDIFLREVYTRGTVQPLVSGLGFQSGASWSNDGKALLFGDTRDRDVWYVPLTDERKPIKLVQASFNQWPGDFSPDGLYVSYTSSETGQREVYVTPFPSGDGQWPVSVRGGRHSRWRGKEIFYVDGNTMMVANVSTEQGFQIGTPQSLFNGDTIQANLREVNVAGVTGLPSYDVSADGQHFVIVQRADQVRPTPPTITVVENWYSEFKDRE